MDLSSPMIMIFNTVTNTPLYSTSWTPQSTGQYAGTCIFLILLASILRCLYALRTVLEQRWLDQARQRRYIVVAGNTPEAEKVERDEDTKSGALLTSQGVEERVRIVKRGKRQPMPWRWGTDFMRAGLATVIVGTAYLL
jgi:hypothetical protein